MQIKRTRIDTEAAWTARSIGGKAGLERKLTATELRAFDTALRNTNGVRPQEATADDFSDPAIVELTDWLGDTIRHGRGAALLYFTEEFGLLTITCRGELYFARRIEIGSSAIASGASNGTGATHASRTTARTSSASIT